MKTHTRSFRVSLFSTCAVLGVVACKGTTFNSSTDNGQKQGAAPGETVPIPVTQSYVPTAPTSGAPGTTGTSTNGGTPCVSGPVDMNYMFLIDTTGSMTSQAKQASSGISTIISRVSSLKEKLGGNVRETRMGFVGYIDQARINPEVVPLILPPTRNLVLPPTKDLAAASAIITNYSSAGSDSSDSSEGGGWAFGTALDLMKKSATDAAGAINIVFLLTDAWSHDGNPNNQPQSSECTSQPNDCHGPRTFNFTPWEAQMADPYFKILQIFDWSPSRSGAPGNGDLIDNTVSRFGSPMGQWAFLRKRWSEIQTVPNSAGGAHLGDVLTNGTAAVGQALDYVVAQIKVCPK